MPPSSRPLVLVAAILTAGLCLFLAFQVAALLLPFVLSSSYRWILALLCILLIGLGAFLRARKRQKAELQLR